MIQHRRHNRVLALKNREGNLIQSHEEMEDELNYYFSTLLSEPRTDQARAIQYITKNILVILIKDHNKMILRKVSMQEVEEVVMTLPTGKVPGLDGFTIGIYEACWSMLKDEVHALVHESIIQIQF